MVFQKERLEDSLYRRELYFPPPDVCKRCLFMGRGEEHKQLKSQASVSVWYDCSVDGNRPCHEVYKSSTECDKFKARRPSAKV